MIRLLTLRDKILSNYRHRNISIHISCAKRQQLESKTNLIEVFIDDKPVQVPPGTTILKVKFL
jgi:hypothetical protein